MEEKLPAIEASLETYFKAIEHYKAGQKFTTYELASKIAGIESKEVIDELSTEIYSHLYQLSAFGIVSFFGASTFAIALTPQDPKEKWTKRLGERGAPIFETVKVTYEKKLKIPRKKPYITVFVGESSVGEVLGYVYNVYNPDMHGGIKIESRGRFNIKARNVADEICKQLSFYKFEIKGISKTPETRPITGDTVIKQEIILEPMES